MKPDLKNQSPQISFLAAVKFWLKLGFISFGGPAGQISIMYETLVEQKRWISSKRFLHALNYTMILPGPEAQQLATYIGWLMHGVKGGIVAGVLFVLPSFVILCVLAWLYLLFGQQPIMQAVLYGIKPAVVAIVLFAAFRIGKTVLKTPFLMALALCSFVVITFLKLPFPYLIVAVGLLGVLVNALRPKWIAVQQSHFSYDSEVVDAVINDRSITAEHILFSWSRLGHKCLFGVGLLLALFLTLLGVYGFESIFTQMAIFFSKAAVVTFGGAYAVLPYVHQAAVESYGWLTSAQMIDGLALGETTPGPLIMIVTFVGFVGGWMAQLSNPLLSAWLAAAIATFCTFLPSFLFILIGGPLVEKSRDDLRFTAPLMAITAAVVGVILNLAWFFSAEVFAIGRSASMFDFFALSLTILSLLLLYRFKQSVITTILLSAVIGVIYRLTF